MSSRSKFRIDDVKKLKGELAVVPPEEIREISKREAIALLGPEIAAMRSNRYSFERISSSKPNVERCWSNATRPTRTCAKPTTGW